jgi:hypothetical protein
MSEILSNIKQSVTLINEIEVDGKVVVVQNEIIDVQTRSLTSNYWINDDALYKKYYDEINALMNAFIQEARSRNEMNYNDTKEE